MELGYARTLGTGFLHPAATVAAAAESESSSSSASSGLFLDCHRSLHRPRQKHPSSSSNYQLPNLFSRHPLPSSSSSSSSFLPQPLRWSSTSSSYAATTRNGCGHRSQLGVVLAEQWTPPMCCRSSARRRMPSCRGWRRPKQAIQTGAATDRRAFHHWSRDRHSDGAATNF